MSSYPYAQYTYPPGDYNDYPVEQLYDYDNSTSPSSFGGGGHAMTATNSSQSMSSTAESPSAWKWDAPQQQQYSEYNTMSSTPQAYFSLPEDPAYTPRQHYQPVQQAQPAQEPSRRQRSTTESAPSALICLHPGCETHGRFKRKADLHRHMDTVHEVKQRFSCPRPRCDRKHDRGFSRKDHLYEHLRNTHGVDVPRAGGERRRRRADAVAA